MEKRIFIWATAFGSPERVKWMQENYKNPITEDEYVEVVKNLPHNHPKASRCRSPSRIRKDYNHLKTNYGFFTPEARAE